MISSDQLPSCWKTRLQSDFDAPYMRDLTSFIAEQQKAGKTIYPDQKHIFSAFDLCSFKELKVVILGQDPYHGPDQAHGLCFSVRPHVAPPPSLVNIYKELQSDLGLEPVSHGFLESWAKQGVLLLNSVLTVEQANAGSHAKKGWEKFTDAVVSTINSEKEGVVFVLWGAYAQKKGKSIDSEKHHIIRAPHPSPLSSYRGFFGSKPFSKINAYLNQTAQAPIDWELPANC